MRIPASDAHVQAPLGRKCCWIAPRQRRGSQGLLRMHPRCQRFLLQVRHAPRHSFGDVALFLGESTSKTHRVYDFCGQFFYRDFPRQSIGQNSGPCAVLRRGLCEVLCNIVLTTTYETLTPMFFRRVFPDQAGYLDA